MKKLLMFLVTLFVVTALVFGQTWEVKKESLDIPVFSDAFFLDANTGWLVLEDNRIDQTTNGGDDWTTLKVDDGSGNDWEEIEFLDANNGYACGDDGLIYKTTNGGTDWIEVGDTANYTEDLNVISVVDANTVYCAGKDTLVLKTVNGGTDWTYQTSTDAASFNGEDIDGGISFINADTGVVISDGNTGSTWYTTDGGTTWTFKEVASLFPPGTISKRLYGVSSAGSTFAVVGYHNCIFISTDGGASYTRSGDFTYGYEQSRAVDVIDDNTIIVTGTDGHTVKTTNAGTSWDTLKIGSGQTATSVNFTDANNGYVFANSGQWFKTTNGGANWAPLNDWPSVSFWGLALPEDNKIVLTAYAGGEMTVSNDGGTSWSYPTNLLTGTPVSLYECEFIDANNGLIGGSSGQIFRTTDGGASWTFTDNPMAQLSNKTINAIHYLDADTVLAGGSSGYILKSVDGGQNWTELVNEGSSTVYDIWPISSTLVLASASSGQIYVSNTAIDSFSTMEDYGSMSMRAVEFRGDVGIVVASSGHIYTTSPTAVANGDSLVEVFVEPEGDDFYDVEFINDFLVYVVGEHGKIYKSVDAGENWTQEISPTTETLDKVRYRNERLFAIGKGGTILLNNLDFSTQPDLFFSEYIEGSGNSKAIEIYNGNVDTVNLSDYTIKGTHNGDNYWNYCTLYLPNKKLAPGDVYIFANSEADAIITAIADTLLPYATNTIASFNGDDARGIFKEGQLIDVIGVPDEDPGTAWSVAGGLGATAEYTLVRKSTVTIGNTDWDASAGTDAVSSEWVVMPQNTFSFLGSHPHTDFTFPTIGGSVAEESLIQIRYSEEVDSTNALDVANYSVDGSAPTSVTKINSTVYTLDAGTITPNTDVQVIVTNLVDNIGLKTDADTTICQYLTIDITATADKYFCEWETDLGPASWWGPTGSGSTHGILGTSTFAMSSDAAYQGTQSAKLDIKDDPTKDGWFVREYNSTKDNIAYDSKLYMYVKCDVPDVQIRFVVDDDGTNGDSGYETSRWFDITATVDDWQVISLDLANDPVYGWVNGNGAIESTDEVSVSSIQLKCAEDVDAVLYFDILSERPAGTDAVTFNTLPEKFALHQNYPNPFNPTTNIQFDLPKAMDVKLVIYDIAGHKVATLVDSYMDAGYKNIVWNGTNDYGNKISSGIYIYRIIAGNNIETMKMSYIK